MTIGLAVSACAYGPLSETPVIGGTEEQRLLAREELVAFATFVGFERVSVRDVRFEPLDGLGGQYGETTRGIWLDADLSGSQVREVLRHELCHAIDGIERLTGHARGLFDPLADALMASEFAPDDIDGAGDKRGEAFAQICELGPLAAAVLEEHCSGDPPGMDVLASWLSENVWTEFPVADPFEWDNQPLAVWTSPVESDGYRILSYRKVLADGSPVASIKLFDGDPFSEEGEEVVGYHRVDLLTGTEVDEDATQSAAGPPEFGLPDMSGLPDLGGWPVGLMDGPAAVLGAVDLGYLGQSATRTFVWEDDDHGWRGTTPNCREDAASEDLFLAAGRIWTTSRRGALVSWAPILAAHP